MASTLQLSNSYYANDWARCAPCTCGRRPRVKSRSDFTQGAQPRLSHTSCSLHAKTAKDFGLIFVVPFQELFKSVQRIDLNTLTGQNPSQIQHWKRAFFGPFLTSFWAITQKRGHETGWNLAVIFFKLFHNNMPKGDCWKLTVLCRDDIEISWKHRFPRQFWGPNYSSMANHIFFLGWEGSKLVQGRVE